MAVSPPDTVLVTGATGFIAGHCLQALVDAGFRVRGTVRPTTPAARRAHLDALRGRNGARVELVHADLDAGAGWADAVRGCAGVLHVASPFPNARPDDESVLVRPAVDGTRRVLEACAADGGVRRVVVTSSLAAVVGGHDDAGERTFTEADWSVAERCDPYRKSKTLAERTAWDLVAYLPPDRRFELAVVNPGFVLGPLLGSDCGTSGELVRKLLTRELPACARLGWAMVDVRDVAQAHVLALTRPEAAGNRYLCAGDHVWMQDVARILAEEFGPAGYRVPTRELPYAVMWLLARFDKTVRMSLDYYGKRESVSSAKLRHELGWTTRPLRETIVDMGHSMIALGVVPAPAGARAPAAAAVGRGA